MLLESKWKILVKKKKNISLEEKNTIKFQVELKKRIKIWQIIISMLLTKFAINNNCLAFKHLAFKHFSTWLTIIC